MDERIISNYGRRIALTYEGWGGVGCLLTYEGWGCVACCISRYISEGPWFIGLSVLDSSFMVPAKQEKNDSEAKVCLTLPG